ncbi:DUF2167 domain-containing protein [Adhaeribacter pallidiroseus]|uniref:DUF2167 domain-containing protein n=1 Tax=Adhaeribacter pallidiroseus TaxID=2072847 RepID=A0A369QPZ6_9BACT|nr:DUF2167 domain-containing protein [Adhaeribacter pallidiroseus]RDC66382.1 hypothetical protein AHMF7616_05013 [Adhaeribacter pallidiroseus]
MQTFLLRKVWVFLVLFLPTKLWAQTVDSAALEREQIEKSFTYQTGTLTLGDNLAKLQVPKGYKFLNAQQSQYVINQLWGNPPDSSTLGMLFPEQDSPLTENSYAVHISYSEEGYIKDDDAQDLDYADLLKEMQQDTRDYNQERVLAGYPAVELVGWASAPFYDVANHKLHWAKELTFGEEEESTLNYNVRVLGRKGYLLLNVIAPMQVLPSVKKNIPSILMAVNFTEGNQYTDFNPDMDEVAKYGIGGLIAGKVLAKAGFFVLLLKFWKVVAAAAMGVFYYLKKKLSGKEETQPELVLANETTIDSSPPVQ